MGSGSSFGFGKFSSVTSHEQISVGASGTTLTALQNTVAVTTTAAGTLTLPHPSQVKERMFTIDFVSVTGILTVAFTGPGTVDEILRIVGDYLVIYSDGTNYWLINKGNRLVEMSQTQSQDTTISTAQVLALKAQEIGVAPAPGAGYINVFEGALLFLDYNSTAYDGVAAGENLVIRYTDDSGAIVAEQETTGFIDQTNDEIVYLYPLQSTADIQNIVPVANVGLFINLLSGEIATGNSPLYVRTFFKVLPSTLS